MVGFLGFYLFAAHKLMRIRTNCYWIFVSFRYEYPNCCEIVRWSQFCCTASAVQNRPTTGSIPSACLGLCFPYLFFSRSNLHIIHLDFVLFFACVLWGGSEKRVGRHLAVAKGGPDTAWVPQTLHDIRATLTFTLSGWMILRRALFCPCRTLCPLQ